MQYRDFTTEVSIDANTITLRSNIRGDVVSSSVVRDGSVETNYKTAAYAHLLASLSLPATATSPRCYLTQLNKWIQLSASSTVTTSLATVKVPAGNSGVLRLNVDAGASTWYYKIASGSYTTFTDGTEITVTDGQTLGFKADGIDEQTSALGTVTDKDTELQVDLISLMNTTPAP